METPSRFPLPWTLHHNDDAYWVEDATGQRFAYCYFRDVQSVGTGRSYLSRDAARRIASNISKLPDIIKRKGEAKEALRVLAE
jgi:hypothetical protein